MSNLQQTSFAHLSKKYTPFEKECKLSVSRKNSLADFRENPDVENLFPWEKVSKKSQEDFGAEGTLFFKRRTSRPPFLDYGGWPPGVDGWRCLVFNPHLEGEGKKNKTSKATGLTALEAPFLTVFFTTDCFFLKDSVGLYRLFGSRN